MALLVEMSSSSKVKEEIEAIFKNGNVNESLFLSQVAENGNFEEDSINNCIYVLSRDHWLVLSMEGDTIINLSVLILSKICF